MDHAAFYIETKLTWALAVIIAICVIAKIAYAVMADQPLGKRTGKWRIHVGGITTFCLMLILSSFGQSAKAETSRDVKLLQGMCDGGDAEVCTNLGLLYRIGGGVVKPDIRKAAGFFKQGCYGGWASGCTNLGYLHIENLIRDQDKEKASELFQKGCDLGDADACAMLGVMFE